MTVRLTSRLGGRSIFLCCLFMSGCVNTLQAQLEQMGLDRYKLYPLKEALLASAFTEYSSTNSDAIGRVKHQMQYFSKSEEEVAQKAMQDKSNIVTTWTNKKYGDLEFRVKKNTRRNGRRCRRFSVTWVEYQYYGIIKHVQRGDACFNPQTQRWEWE